MSLDICFFHIFSEASHWLNCTVFHQTDPSHWNLFPSNCILISFVRQSPTLSLPLIPSHGICMFQHVPVIIDIRSIRFKPCHKSLPFLHLRSKIRSSERNRSARPSRHIAPMLSDTSLTSLYDSVDRFSVPWQYRINQYVYIPRYTSQSKELPLR